MKLGVAAPAGTAGAPVATSWLDTVHCTSLSPKLTAPCAMTWACPPAGGGGGTGAAAIWPADAAVAAASTPSAICSGGAMTEGMSNWHE